MNELIAIVKRRYYQTIFLLRVNTLWSRVYLNSLNHRRIVPVKTRDWLNLFFLRYDHFRAWLTFLLYLLVILSVHTSHRDSVSLISRAFLIRSGRPNGKGGIAVRGPLMPLFPLRMLTVPLSSYAPRCAIPVIVIILSLRLSLLVLPFS